MERILQESEEKYRKLIEIANDAIFLADVETGIILEANKQTEKLLGVPAEEIMGMHHTQVYPPEDVERNKELFNKYSQFDKSITLEDIFVQHKDGRKIPVEISSSVFKLGSKKVILGIFRDITERKKIKDDLRKSEGELKESKALLEKAQELTQIGHWKLIPPIGKVTGSDELFRIFGLSREEATLDSFVEVVHPDDREMDVAAIQRGAEHGESWNIEHRLICRDSKEKWVHAIGEAITDGAGDVVGLIGTVQNITERKRIEDALRQSKEQMQSILDNTTAVIYLKDTHGKYILINRQYQDIFHITKDVIIGKTDYDIFPKEMADEFQANDRKVLKAHAPLEMEEIALHDDGSHTYISIKFPLFDSNGIPYAVCGISTDITERKKTEELLQKQKNDLEQKNIALNEILGQIEIEKKQIKDNVIANAENLLLAHYTKAQTNRRIT